MGNVVPAWANDNPERAYDMVLLHNCLKKAPARTRVDTSEHVRVGQEFTHNI